MPSTPKYKKYWELITNLIESRPLPAIVVPYGIYTQNTIVYVAAIRYYFFGFGLIFHIICDIGNAISFVIIYEIDYLLLLGLSCGATQVLVVTNGLFRRQSLLNYDLAQRARDLHPT